MASQLVLYKMMFKNRIPKKKKSVKITAHTPSDYTPQEHGAIFIVE